MTDQTTTVADLALSQSAFLVSGVSLGNGQYCTFSALFNRRDP